MQIQIFCQVRWGVGVFVCFVLKVYKLSLVGKRWEASTFEVHIVFGSKKHVKTIFLGMIHV